MPNATKGGTTRRSVLAMSAAAAAFPSTARSAPAAASKKSAPNIVFVFTDQERYRLDLPAGLTLPAHETMRQTGVTFHNHYCPATMCTSSRSVLLTGLQTADNKMFENTDVPWVGSMSTNIPTIGHMLRKAGYYTAYKGKWHLSPKFDVADDLARLNKEMDRYGFSDFHSPGDIMAHALGGYEFDHLIAGTAVTWLRRQARALSNESKPWCLFVSLINPHDIMYFNTDLPGQSVQDTGNLFMHAARAPDTEWYKKTWDIPVAASLKQPMEEASRPPAHGEFHRIWNYVLGEIPPEEDRWRRFNDFYVNSLRAVDLQLANILQELEALNLSDRTIVVFTADHGEMSGAHGLRGKGPFVYEETTHLPFLLRHPDVKGGQDCHALSGHIDIVPTLLGMANVDPTKRAEFARRSLPGKDLTPLLSNPGGQNVHAAHESILFTYSGLGTVDSGLFKLAAEAKAAGNKPISAIVKNRYVPDLKKRGSVRMAFDGQYKFTRYFSPLDHNKPKTLDDLYRDNDVELYDLKADPEEMTNLATDRTANSKLVETMMGKLEAAIAAEIGVDDGRELPYIPLVTWGIDRVS